MKPHRGHTAMYDLVTEVCTMYYGVSVVDFTDDWFDGVLRLTEQARDEIRQSQEDEKASLIEAFGTSNYEPKMRPRS